MSYKGIVREVRRYARAERARISTRFFKTGPGEYSEGDVFIGLTMGEQRTIVKKFAAASFPTIEKLLKSIYHEHRMIGLLILVMQYQKATEQMRARIFDFYLTHTASVNNWDLVDATAAYIVGDYLLHRPKRERRILCTLARSHDLWERRIAIVATHQFIKHGQCEDTFTLAVRLQTDTEDLIHKAVGWMLREAGKYDLSALETFLKTQIRTLPRTTLRYAIERFPEAKRRYYLAL